MLKSKSRGDSARVGEMRSASWFFFFPSSPNRVVPMRCQPFVCFIGRRGSGTRESKVTVSRRAACRSEFGSCTRNINIDARLKEISLPASREVNNQPLNLMGSRREAAHFDSWVVSTVALKPTHAKCFFYRKNMR